MWKKSKLKKIKAILCFILGHEDSFVIEYRTRIFGHGKHKHGNTVIGFNRKGGKSGRIREVLGGYHSCTRCGKKLSNWRRIY